MITDLLGKHVQTAERAEDWKDAIRMAVILIKIGFNNDTEQEGAE